MRRARVGASWADRLPGAGATALALIGPGPNDAIARRYCNSCAAARRRSEQRDSLAGPRSDFTSVTPRGFIVPAHRADEAAAAGVAQCARLDETWLPGAGRAEAVHRVDEVLLLARPGRVDGQVDDHLADPSLAAARSSTVCTTGRESPAWASTSASCMRQPGQLVATTSAPVATMSAALRAPLASDSS